MARICVFCGSRSGARTSYLETARDVGALLARRNLGLVYGGARRGLMGAIADAVLAAGGDVIGVIPNTLVEREIAHTGLPDLRIVDSMHQRKALMADLSDGFIAMPGGYGTFEELFEIITWAGLGLHSKPVGILNTDGFYDPLLALLDAAVDEKFAEPSQRRLIVSDANANPLLDIMSHDGHKVLSKHANPKNILGRVPRFSSPLLTTQNTQIIFVFMDAVAGEDVCDVEILR